MGSAGGRWVLAATVLGSGLALLDSTVVNVALRDIGAEFGTSFAALQWTVNAYTLTLASLILLGGSLGDRYGRRRIFVIGVVWFAVASALCGAAPNAEWLIAARALQGVGGALLTPGSLAIISASFARTDRVAAIGAWSGLGGVAAAIGPLLGGVLLEWSWRWVFLINLPVAVVIVLIASRHVPESRDRRASAKLDVTGATLVVLGLAGLTYALTAVGESGASPSVIGVWVTGVAALAAFAVVQRRSEHPLVAPEMFRNAQFNAANAVTLLVYGGLGVMLVLLVLQLQVVSGFTALLAGAALLPVTALMLVLSARTGALAQRIGPRIPMSLGPLLCAVGALLLLRIDTDASYASAVLPAMVVFGLGLSLTVAPLTATVLGSASDRHAGVASGVNNAIARAAGLLTVAVVPVVAGISGNDYTEPAAFDDGFDTAMLICAALFVTAAVVAFGTIRATPGVMPDEPSETGATAESAERVRIEQCNHCGIGGPQIHPFARDR